ncbi:putative bifunctional E2/E3 enzyme [Mycena sanguinolenta]|uniref:Putative bifunctional E2/E3 enzyme n=1 Tax=Mycena sanguinolenta TaxID=230812 RepID=A0A8H7CNQ9_9AGAR|nr:putative bifunctional E2/E3 enzyme [Mycena sanguinolenta]
MIGENDIVTARPRSPIKLPSNSEERKPRSHLTDMVQDDPIHRFRIGFVTAENALSHAKQTAKEQSEATNGTLAFDGEMISGNITLRELQREAVRVLEWASPNAMEVDDDGPCIHEEELNCSCQISQQVEQHGLLDMLHCRFTIDGSSCMNAECPYSHVKLEGPSTASPPHCSLCDEALGFPCPSCLDLSLNAGETPDSVVFCPLVQNAGCNHLHHAHCIGARYDPRPLSCPAGCPIHRFSREAADFSIAGSNPHLILVWDGDRIDKIPVHSSLYISDGDSVLLSTEAIISAVETFLDERGFALPGLSMRVHFRDARSEAVRFTQSTLISVCPASSHLNQAYRRFPLFQSRTCRSAPRAPTASFSVDLHTAHAPIVACGCTPIQRLFGSSSESPPSERTPHVNTLWLYAVRRKTESTSADSDAVEKRGTVSKESAYLSDAAWQPSVVQTPRGMAALLSSLYIFSHSVAQKGIAAEQKVLATAYAVLRFPPAIRTLAGLLFNKVPRPEEKAALAESLYHALKDFSARGPAAIITRETRRFETVRILLAYVTSAADAESTATAQRPVEEISVVCTLSRKRLRDPVLLNSAIVERGVAALHQRGGALFRPKHATAASASPVVQELPDTDPIASLLPCLPGLSDSSVLFFRVNDIGWAPRAFMSPLDSAARDFVFAIRQANQSDLVSQGPLELKSVDVVPPRIVVDQNGFLAVFTGRGCGTSRDVNFFRPTHGGDTEVDVNDVGHALQKVIKVREAEDTWQVDSFGGILNISRPPDEAIVLCLDLSYSMNRKSGIRGSDKPAPRGPEEQFDAEAETNSIVAKYVDGMTDSEIVDSAKTYLQPLHSECHRPWASLSEQGGPRGSILLDGLAVLAGRHLLKLSFIQEAQDGTISNQTVVYMKELSCFISAVANNGMKEQMRSFLIEFLDGPAVAIIGIAPFDVPRKYIDFTTGELLTDPVHPINAPPGVFVNSASRQWLEGGLWPLGHSVSSDLRGGTLKNAVEAWVRGTEILSPLEASLEGDFITVTLHHFGETTSWRLPPSSTTRTLYSLAHRATSARYSSFKLKPKFSSRPIEQNTTLRLERTALASGGSVEMVQCTSHNRKSLNVEVPCTYGGPSLRMVVPRDASVLLILSYVEVWAGGMPGSRFTDITLWHGLHDCGDGDQRGYPQTSHSPLWDLVEDDPSKPIVLESREWRQTTGGARQARDESKHLTRLHLLKELFNVFLNRASSFDTSVSLVLGLVTFSDKASEDQELTPIFENFRQQLDRKEAGGDTSIYDALDSARRMLTQFRPDLPKLKKRIIIVSDGEDTSSTTSAQELARGAIQSCILYRLRQEGTVFSPNTSLPDALSIFDLETMLYSGDRSPREGEPSVKLVTSPSMLRSYQNLARYPVDLITVDKFPARAAHPLLKKPVKAAVNSIGMTGPGGSDDRMKRIMREIKAVVADPHPRIDVYFNDSDMSFLKIILEAPTDVENCPYKGGTFLLTCNLPAGYPRDPPEIRFVTFIMHPNVSKQGKVSHLCGIAELGRLWSSDITLKEIFSLIYGTLLVPDLENPLELQASLKYYDDDGTYALAVAEATAKHAAKSRAQWKAELDG